jgi:hypothetical protein
VQVVCPSSQSALKTLKTDTDADVDIDSDDIDSEHVPHASLLRYSTLQVLANGLYHDIHQDYPAR